LDYQLDKYSAIPLASIWAKELRRKEENRHMTANEILELALRDVLGGQVDWKSMKKALAAAGPESQVPAEEAKGDRKRHV
jgi:hypothetical protein